MEQLRGMERPELIPCPLCEGQKKKGCLVCFNCHQIHVREAADAVLNGQTPLSKEDWGEEKIRARIPELKESVAKVVVEYRHCQELQSKKINEILTERVRDQELPSDVLAEVRKRLQEEQGREIWKEVGGPKTYYQLRTAEARLKEAARLLQDLAAKKTANIEEVSPPLLSEVSKVKSHKASGSSGEEKENNKSRPRAEKLKGGRNGEKVALLQEVNSAT